MPSKSKPVLGDNRISMVDASTDSRAALQALSEAADAAIDRAILGNGLTDSPKNKNSTSRQPCVCERETRGARQLQEGPPAQAVASRSAQGRSPSQTVTGGATAEEWDDGGHCEYCQAACWGSRCLTCVARMQKTYGMDARKWPSAIKDSGAADSRSRLSDAESAASGYPNVSLKPRSE